jgi:amino acid adenylation domain-containing protein
MSKSANVSYAQERLWFLDQWQPGNLAYNISVAYRLIGSLDVPALERSLNEIIRRHEILRTTFATVDGRPAQIVAPSPSVRLLVVDLRDFSEERAAQVQRLAMEETQHPFDLAKGPLLRVTLLRLANTEQALLITAHRIVFDDWSIGVFNQELATLYEACSARKSSPLPDLPIQYADYADWQRQWLQGKALEEQLAYWKQRLDGRLSPLELPTDRPRPAVQTFRGARYAFVLNESLSGALRDMSRREDATLFALLLTAFKVLLYRYTEQKDIVVGFPVAARGRSETEKMIGPLLNMLVLRTDLSGASDFRALLGRVREAISGALAHQALPFEKLVDVLQPERDLSRTPLFQVVFVFQNTRRKALALSDLTVDPIEFDSGTTLFDLTLSVEEAEQGFRGSIEYNTDLFNAGTIARMAEYFQTLLKGIAANPEQRLSQLPLLTEGERYQLLVEWNNTRNDYPRDRCIHHLFEAQVRQTPHATALVFGDRQLTYSELNRQASQLAHYLQTKGVGPEVLVGILLERSVEMVICLLAVLKAGGVYLPLDPTHPKERLEFMLADSRAAVLLTHSRLQSLCHQAQVVCVDTEWEHIITMSQTALASAVAPENLAYAIYTSGSTGRPKGVQICHQAVVNFLEAMRHEPGLTAKDILLSVTTLSFDIAALESFLPLGVGACLVLASQEMATDATQLMRRLACGDITVMQATPTTWHMLLASGWQGNQRMKILCGGETLSRELAAQLLPRSAALWNMYGPTETTIWSSVYQVTGKEDASIPIGRPIANTEFYLLDEYFQPLPVGIPGRLYIGGAGVARGYLNRPGLSAERFVPHPFSQTAGARLYDTGDLARYREDGSIEYTGRADFQVKVRGFRIEPGEIEAALEQHSQVQRAVAVVREDVPGDRRIVAYCVPSSEQKPAVNDLRCHVQEILPEYMVPSVFIILDAMPLTPGGKVDRRALPVPESARPDLEEAFVVPATQLEKEVAGIWGELLGFGQIGLHDNFLELGGHSLLAIQLVFRINQAFQVDVSLREVLTEGLTVAGLVNVIENALFEQAGTEELAELLAEMDELSEDQVRALLASPQR